MGSVLMTDFNLALEFIKIGLLDRRCECIDHCEHRIPKPVFRGDEDIAGGRMTVSEVTD